MMRQVLLGSIALASFSVACVPIENPLETRGELGKATFAYAGCLIECSLDEAMMHGTEESISVSASDMPAVTVTSTAPSVVVKNATPMRSCCPVKANGQSCRPIQPTDSCNADETANIGIDVVASEPGSAELVLTQTDGTVFDRVAIAVAEPASLKLDMGTSTFSIGTRYAVAWTASDAKGNKLMSTSGVHMVTSDASVIDFKRTFLSSNSSSVDAEDIIFGTTMEPHAHGDATITATAQNVTTTFAAHVN